MSIYLRAAERLDANPDLNARLDSVLANRQIGELFELLTGDRGWILICDNRQHRILVLLMAHWMTEEP